MKENKITVVIDKPVEEVFKFTTNPENTPRWIESIKEEVADSSPPKIGTIYKNRGKDSDWDFYKVTAIKKDKLFALTDLDGNYSVQYSYRKLDYNKTELEYFEWIKQGELKNPVTNKTLNQLKTGMEKRK